jgi:hypothetical protein
MKKTTFELSVDFIGGMESLTKQEEIALTKYFQQKKQKKENKKIVGQANVKTRRLENI